MEGKGWGEGVIREAAVFSADDADKPRRRVNGPSAHNVGLRPGSDPGISPCPSADRWIADFRVFGLPCVPAGERGGNSHAEPRRSPRGSCCRTQAFRPVPYANGVLASSPGLVRGTRTTLGWMPIRTSTATRLWPRMGAGVALAALLLLSVWERNGGEKPQSREAAKGTGGNSVCRPV